MVNYFMDCFRIYSDMVGWIVVSVTKIINLNFIGYIGVVIGSTIGTIVVISMIIGIIISIDLDSINTIIVMVVFFA